MSVNLTNQILLLEETRNLWEQFCKIAPPIDGFGPFGVTVVDVTRSFDDVLGLFRAANERTDDFNRIAMSQLMPSADSLVSQLIQTMQTSQGNPAAIFGNPEYRRMAMAASKYHKENCADSSPHWCYCGSCAGRTKRENIGDR